MRRNYSLFLVSIKYKPTDKIYSRYICVNDLRLKVTCLGLPSSSIQIGIVYANYSVENMLKTTTELSLSVLTHSFTVRKSPSDFTLHTEVSDPGPRKGSAYNSFRNSKADSSIN